MSSLLRYMLSSDLDNPVGFHRNLRFKNSTKASVEPDIFNKRLPNLNLRLFPGQNHHKTRGKNF